MYEEISLNRNDLFEEIWSEPMSVVAKKYSLSDVGLAKICKKLKIPIPGRGYWQKGNLERPSLPPLKYGEEATYILHREKKEFLPIDEAHDEAAKSLIALEELPQNKIQVPLKLISPHHLVEKTSNTLSKGEVDKYGRVSSRGKENCLNVSISPGSITRAVGILNVLMKRFDERGFSVFLRENPYRSSSRHWLSTFVTVLKQDIDISLEESVKQIEIEYPPSKRKERDNYSWLYREKYKYVPSGELSLKINNVHWGNIRKTWSDGRKSKLEELLNDFVIGLIKASSVLRSKALQEEIELKKEEDLRRQRIERERERRKEQEQLQKLLQNVDKWHKSKQIREYIAAVKENAILKNVLPSALENWLSWAGQQADQIDPFYSMRFPDI